MPASAFLILLAHGQLGAWDEIALITLAVLTVGLILALTFAGRRWFAAEREEDESVTGAG